MLSTRIKETGEYAVDYITIKGKTKEELFDNIYKFFKSDQCCWQITIELEDKELAKEYYEWKSKKSENLLWKHTSGRDLIKYF